MQRLATVLVGALALPLASCADDAEAADLLSDLQADDYRNSYARAPGWEDPRLESLGPHGEFVDIYVNDVLEDALDEEGLEQWPVGSVIVKDGWEDAEGESLRYIAVMEKRSGGSWFWAEYDSNQDVAYAGLDESTCTGCHSSGDDQVRAFSLP